MADLAFSMIDPTNATGLEAFGRWFWLNELQPLRAGEALSASALAEAKVVAVQNVDHLVVETNLDCGCSRETQVILTMATGGSLSIHTALRAVWASYMASLKATMDAGKNRRAHVGDDADAMDLVAREVAELSAVLTPCNEVYGSGGTYLESLDCRYDAETRTLTVNPSIGS